MISAAAASHAVQSSDQYGQTGVLSLWREDVDVADGVKTSSGLAAQSETREMMTLGEVDQGRVNLSSRVWINIRTMTRCYQVEENKQHSR